MSTEAEATPGDSAAAHAAAAAEQPGFGARLRQARDGTGRTVAEVADKLHFDARVIQALENEDLPAMGAAVYARGHLRRYAEYLNLPRNTRLEKSLHAVDELAGFLVAVALVRPGRTLEGIEASSIKKKMKDKAFARAVSRDDIVQGAQELGEPFDEHVVFVARALQAASGLGLGTAEPASA